LLQCHPAGKQSGDAGIFPASFLRVARCIFLKYMNMHFSATRLLALAALIFLLACNKDDTTPPDISITEPTEGFETFGSFRVVAHIHDNKKVQAVQIKVTDLADGTVLFESQTTPDVADVDIDQVISVDFPRTDDYELKISAADPDNNIQSASVLIRGRLAAHLALNFKLQYDGQPMVMFEDYAYPEMGFNFFLTRVSMYVSNVQPVGNNYPTLENIGLLRLEEAHQDAASAAAGYTYELEVPPGFFESIQFGLGIPPELNAQKPADFPTSNPLSKSGEYWDSWNSYIFTKVEGKADLNNDPGDFNEALMALHMGSDNAFRDITIHQSGPLIEGQTTTVEVVLDMKDFFFQNGEVYDLTNPDNVQIHSILQMDQVNDLSDRMKHILESN